MKNSPLQATVHVVERLSTHRRKAIPHSFVLDAIADRSPVIRAMSGALVVYVGDRIVFILTECADVTAANGVWLAVSPEHEFAVPRSRRCVSVSWC